MKIKTFFKDLEIICCRYENGKKIKAGMITKVVGRKAGASSYEFLILLNDKRKTGIDICGAGSDDWDGFVLCHDTKKFINPDQILFRHKKNKGLIIVAQFCESATLRILISLKPKSDFVDVTKIEKQ